MDVTSDNHTLDTIIEPSNATPIETLTSLRSSDKPAHNDRGR